MVEVKASKIDVMTSFGSTKLLVDIEGRLSAAEMDAIHSADRPWRLALKPWRERRSLDANAYCFVLIHKIAEATGDSVSSIYRKAIKEIGGVSHAVCVMDNAVDALVDGWCRNGLGWQTEVMPSKLPGCKNVILYYGSSTYDTDQMRRLIDYIIQDCEGLGIETKTPEQIESMLALWGEQDGKKHH